MTYSQTLIDKLNNAKSEIERKMLFLAWLNSRLKQEGSKTFPILVGGTAVEFYTDGKCYSFDFDIDLVYDADERFDKILNAAGFVKRGRYWENDDLMLVVECPGSTNERPEKIIEIYVNNESVFVISLEDLIVDRMNGFVFWENCRDNSEYLKQIKLLTVGKDIDYEYMLRRSKEEGTYEALEKVYSRP